MFSRRDIFIASLLVGVFVLAVGLYIFFDSQGYEESAPNLETEKIFIPEVPLPKIDWGVAPPSYYSASQRTVFAQRLGEIKSRLEENAYDFSAWIDLGLQYELIKDYENARISWEYASALKPQSSLPLTNLGFLYAYQLKDLELAEKYLLEAIRLEPKLDSNYYRIYEFYRDILKDLKQALEVVEEGIKANPKSGFLKSLKTQILQEI